MKIANIQASIHTVSIEVPLLEGRIEGYGREEQRHFVVCRLETDDGLIGTGVSPVES